MKLLTKEQIEHIRIRDVVGKTRIDGITIICHQAALMAVMEEVADGCDPELSGTMPVDMFNGQVLDRPFLVPGPTVRAVVKTLLAETRKRIGGGG